MFLTAIVDVTARKENLEELNYFICFQNSLLLPFL